MREELPVCVCVCVHGQWCFFVWSHAFSALKSCVSVVFTEENKNMQFFRTAVWTYTFSLGGTGHRWLWCNLFNLLLIKKGGKKTAVKVMKRWILRYLLHRRASHDNYKQSVRLSKATNPTWHSNLTITIDFSTFIFFEQVYIYEFIVQKKTRHGLSSFHFLHAQSPSRQVCPGIKLSGKLTDHSPSKHGSGAV